LIRPLDHRFVRVVVDQHHLDRPMRADAFDAPDPIFRDHIGAAQSLPRDKLHVTSAREVETRELLEAAP
jgi:hypothetical protein